MTITCFKSRHFSTFPVFFQRISAHSKKYKLFSYPPATDYFVFANFAHWKNACRTPLAACICIPAHGIQKKPEASAKSRRHL